MGNQIADVKGEFQVMEGRLKEVWLYYHNNIVLIITLQTIININRISQLLEIMAGNLQNKMNSKLYLRPVLKKALKG